MHFREWNVCTLINVSLKFVPNGPIKNNPGIGLDNVLAPKRRQAIIWTNNSQKTPHIPPSWVTCILITEEIPKKNIMAPNCISSSCDSQHLLLEWLHTHFSSLWHWTVNAYQCYLPHNVFQQFLWHANVFSVPCHSLYQVNGCEDVFPLVADHSIVFATLPTQKSKF